MQIKILVILLLLITFSACNSTEDVQSNNLLTGDQIEEINSKYQAEDPVSIETNKNSDVELTGMGTKITFETTKGKIVVQLYVKAKITSANFKELVSQGFYDGLSFHRYEPGFVIQGGDPQTKGNPNHPAAGTGGSDKNIELEIIPELSHKAGVIAMARSQDPNSASSQFYFTLADAHFLDGQYAVFGKVVEGMDVVLELRKGDVMEKVSLG